MPYGVGRKILAYGQEASSDPAKLYTAVFGAAVLGLVDVDRWWSRSTGGLMRNRPQETS